MSSNEELNEKQETAKLKLSPSNAESKKIIEDTYSFYSSQKVEIEEEISPVTTKRGTSPLVKKGTSELKQSDVEIYTEINSIDSLNSDLQEQIKSSMNSDKKALIQQIVNEIAKDEQDFFTKEDSILGSLKKVEKDALAQKVSEMQVPKEITEVNVSAIISCIGNIKPRKIR